MVHEAVPGSVLDAADAYLADVVMTYLVGVVLISTRFDFRVSIATAVFSVLAFAFVFIPPYLTFSATDLRPIVTFAVMLLVAVVVADGWCATSSTWRASSQARRASRRSGSSWRRRSGEEKA